MSDYLWAGIAFFLSAFAWLAGYGVGGRDEARRQVEVEIKRRGR